MEKKRDYLGAIALLHKLKKNISEDDPLYLEYVTHLANDCYMQGLYTEAERYAEKAFSINPEDRVGNTLAICQLFNGKIVDGFYNYKYRWGSNDVLKAQYEKLNASIPYLQHWDDAKGKRLFIIGEQGFGDDIMFSHVFKYVEGYCSDIFLLSRFELGTFFRHNLSGCFKMHTESHYTTHEDFLKENYDYIVTSGDLFRAYVLKFKEFPELSLYECDECFGYPIGQLNVGIMVSPGTKGNAVKERQVPSNVFKRFSKKYSLNSFQIGVEVPYARNVSNKINSFLDTANYINDLVGVITVDTAFAHLAASMGIPTVVLYNKYLDWRFRCSLYSDRVKTVSIKNPKLEEIVSHYLGVYNVDFKPT
jgi:tetratricopeptide (TPR) repeat protein